MKAAAVHTLTLALFSMAYSATAEVWVDFNRLGEDSGTGSFAQPYKTLADGIAHASPGDTIRIVSGRSAETLTASQPTTLLAHEGTVRIGDRGGGDKQPFAEYTFPIAADTEGTFTTWKTETNRLNVGPVLNPGAEVEQIDGALYIRPGVQWAGFLHSMNGTVNEHDLQFTPDAVLPWPIVASLRGSTHTLYVRTKGNADWKVELKGFDDGMETLRTAWAFNDFSETTYVDIYRSIPEGISPLKYLILSAEPGSELFVDEVGFYIDSPDCSALRTGFLYSLAQLLRCFDPDTGLVRDASQLPATEKNPVPALGYVALAVACASELGIVDPLDAEAVAIQAIDNLLAVPAHESGFLPEFTRSYPMVRREGSKISTVDTSLAYLTAYIASLMLGLETRADAILDKITHLDYDAVTDLNGFITHGFDVMDMPSEFVWADWGGETAAVFIVALMNDPSADFMRDTDPPVFRGRGFIMELAPLFFPELGVVADMPDQYGTDWRQARLDLLGDQMDVRNLPVFFGGYSPAEIVAADGAATFLEAGSGDNVEPQPVVGAEGFGEPFVMPHYPAMAAALDPDAAAARVAYMRANGLMYPMTGPVESVLLDTDTLEPVRPHYKQIAANAFFSSIGYYHAIIADEGATDELYANVEAEGTLLELAWRTFARGPQEP